MTYQGEFYKRLQEITKDPFEAMLAMDVETTLTLVFDEARRELRDALGNVLKNSELLDDAESIEIQTLKNMLVAKTVIMVYENWRGKWLGMPNDFVKKGKEA